MTAHFDDPAFKLYALASTVDRTRQTSVFQEIAARISSANHLPSRLRHALSHLFQSPNPISTVKELATAVGCDRRTLWRMWRSAVAEDSQLRLQDMIDWNVLLHATVLRMQSASWVGIASRLTIHEHTLARSAKRLAGMTLRELFVAPAGQTVRQVMSTDLIVAREDMDQEALSHLFAESDLPAIPVVDATGRMKGIVTVDDIVDVVQEEATEDIQKLGGMEALEAPYMKVGFLAMVRKRGIWLSALLVGEMLTATAMGYFEDEIARAVVLALFVPLIISSGGNSGSQATTLVIRAMALGEVTLRDWWRVVRREIGAGLALGTVLGVLGVLRIVVWHAIVPTYGPHTMLLAWTVGVSLVGVVTFGTVAGSLLPFLLRRLRLDPASASAPFVATLVDVTGIVIYFTVARAFLRGRLL